MFLAKLISVWTLRWGLMFILECYILSSFCNFCDDDFESQRVRNKVLNFVADVYMKN